jgi:putative transposase
MSEKYKIRNQEKAYFITYAVTGWVDVFTRAEYKDLLLDNLRYCQKEKGLEVYAWCIMSNHIHMAVGTEGSNKIEDIIRDFKKFTSVVIMKAIEENERESRREWMMDIFRKAAIESKKHQKYKFWQNEYHPKELFDRFVFKRCLDYIHRNPVKERIVENPEEYLYSSARDYAGLKGLLDIKWI